MKHQQLCDRTKSFALRIIKMYASLPKSTEAQLLDKQALRSATGVAANYREASRARSDAELVCKFGLVDQQLNETLLWLELLAESSIVPEARLSSLRQEGEPLLRIVVSAIRTTKRRS